MNHMMKGLVIAVVGVFAVIGIMQMSQEDNSATDQNVKMWPGLADRLEDIDEVVITTPSGVITLQKTGMVWGMAEKEGYPVQTAKVHTLLRTLAEVHLAEKKTANAEYHERLAVIEPAADNAAKRLSVSASEQDWIVGKTQTQGTRGNYVRAVGDDQVYLTDQAIAITETDSQWLEKAIVDVPSKAFLQVVIQPQDGETFTLRKPDVDTINFAVDPIPTGRELQSETAANAIVAVLTALNLDDVAKQSSVSALIQTRQLTFDKADGLRLVATVYQDEAGEKWLSLVAQVNDERLRAHTLAEKMQNMAAVASAEDKDAEHDDVDAPAAQMADVADDIALTEEEFEQAAQTLDASVQAYNQKWQGWVYQLPEYKMSNLTKNLEDLLKQPQAESEES